MTDPHRFAYSVYCVSASADEALREAYYEFFSRLKAIVEGDRGEKTIVRSLNIQDVSVLDVPRR